MKIFVVGTRGIPDIAGGVETHCQMLYPLIVAKGVDVCVAARKSYVNKERKEWHGVKVSNCYAPKSKAFEAIIHTFLAILQARKYHPDIIHIHAIGPALLTPLARILGYKVVFTHHGPDYNRQKWGLVAKTVLRLGEFLGCYYADQIIAISQGIKDIASRKSRTIPAIIYNGVHMPSLANKTDYLAGLGITPGSYVLAVARLVPEKGLHDLIDAVIEQPDLHLVIAGDADHATAYSEELKKRAKKNKNITITGFIRGTPLHQLYSQAKLFVLPSYHEGMPIVLLEAMSYGLSILASDIQANIDTGLPENRYFKCGDVNELKDKIRELTQQEISDDERCGLLTLVRERYNWKTIAEQTIDVYENICPEKI